MIYYYYKVTPDDHFSHLKEMKKGCWIHIDEATVDELELVCSWTGIDLSDVQDALDRYELPRIELLDHNVLIHTRHPIEHEGHLHTMTLSLLLTPEYFITISPTQSSLIASLIYKKNTPFSTDRIGLLTHILSKCTHEFSMQIRKTRHSVVAQEKEMIHVQSEDILALTKYEEILNQYYSSLGAIRFVLESIIQGRFTSVFGRDYELFDDVLNTAKQSEDLCDIVIKNIRSLRDSYQIIFANNITKTIKLLTAITILFSIPTMIASIYGMNVDLPMAKEPHAFSILMTITLICSIVCGYLFYKKRWL